MRRIYTRILLLLLYVVILGYVLYPRGASLREGEGLRWLLVMALRLTEEPPHACHEDRSDDPEPEGQEHREERPA